MVPLLEYICNYDYITKELCENKDNLVMGCIGKCYLMKELAKASETEKPISSDKKHIPTETSDLFIADLLEFNLATVEMPTSATQHPAYNNLYAHLQIHSHFHPPTVTA